MGDCVSARMEVVAMKGLPYTCMSAHDGISFWSKERFVETCKLTSPIHCALSQPQNPDQRGQSIHCGSA